MLFYLKKFRDAFDYYVPWGFNFWMFVIALMLFTSLVTISLLIIQEKYCPKEFPKDFAKSSSLFLGWPGPIIDIHVERPPEFPEDDEDFV